MLRYFGVLIITILTSFSLTGCSVVLTESGRIIRSVSSCNETTITGSGIQTDPYILCNETQLLTIASAANGKFYKLGKDIALSSTFLPITLFKGDLDGGSHVITGLKLNKPSSDRQGFFDSLDNGAKIHDIIFDGAVVYGNQFAGVIAGEIGNALLTTVTLENITIKNSSVTAANYSGLFAGKFSKATLTNVKAFQSSVAGSSYVGLIAGRVSTQGILNGAIVQGNVSGGQYVGGAFGYANNTTIQQLAINASVSVPPTNTEVAQTHFGLVAGKLLAVTIDDADVVGQLVNESTSAQYLGQLAGEASTTTIRNSIFAAANFSDPIVATSSTSGFIGSDGGGNDAGTGVYFFTHANTFAEAGFGSIYQINETNMKLQGSFPLLDFSTKWRMAQETGFQFPILQSQSSTEAFSGTQYSAATRGAVWVDETLVLASDGHTFEPTSSVDINYAWLTLHNDSGANINLSSYAMALQDSFQLATDANVGTCVMGSTLANAATCTIGIKFAPSGTLTGQITLRDQLLIDYSLGGIHLTASHLVDAVSMMNETLILGGVQSLPVTIVNHSSSTVFTIKNVGLVTGEIISYAWSGGPAIAIDSTNCPVHTFLTYNAQCTIALNFIPVSVFTYLGNLTITYKDTGTSLNKTAVVNISGSGIAHPFNNDPAGTCQLADGGVASPFCVYDAVELSSIRNYSDKYFIQTQDINLSSLGCNGFAPIASFTGVYNGQTHEISNFCYNNTATQNAALFSLVSGASSSITNISITNFSVSGADKVGGLIGTLDGGTVDSITINNASIQSQSASPQDSTSGSGVGALVGFVNSTENVTISNIYATGSVVATHWNAGGLIGKYANPMGSVSNCNSAVIVTGESEIGGLIGFAQSGGISLSIASGAVTSQNCGGGFVGMMNQSSISSSSSTGVVSGTALAGGIGGFAGCMIGTATINSSFSSGNVSAANSNSVGGFIGASYGSESIVNSYSTSTVIGKDYVGGFIGGGNGTGSTVAGVQNSYFSGASVSGVNYVGGFIGSNGGVVGNSFSSGTSVTSTGNYAGGFAGENTGTIYDSFSAIRSITSAANSGGFVGLNSSIVSTSYTLADSIISSGIKNGFVAVNSGAITYSYFNFASALTDPVATGLVSGVMATVGSYSSFDFAFPVWKMPSVNPQAHLLSPVPMVFCGTAGIVCP